MVKAYDDANKEKRKLYYQKHKETWNKIEPKKCECGCTVTHMSEHIKNPKHFKLMKSLTIKD